MFASCELHHITVLHLHSNGAPWTDKLSGNCERISLVGTHWELKLVGYSFFFFEIDIFLLGHGVRSPFLFICLFVLLIVNDRNSTWIDLNIRGNLWSGSGLQAGLVSGITIIIRTLSAFGALSPCHPCSEAGSLPTCWHDGPSSCKPGSDQPGNLHEKTRILFYSRSSKSPRVDCSLDWFCVCSKIHIL